MSKKVWIGKDIDSIGLHCMTNKYAIFLTSEKRIKSGKKELYKFYISDIKMVDTVIHKLLELRKFIKVREVGVYDNHINSGISKLKSVLGEETANEVLNAIGRKIKEST